MKYLFVFAFILFSQLSFAQKKGDNTIIIHEQINKAKVIEVLFNNGYIVDKNDSSFVSTDFTSVGASHLKLAFNLKDTITAMKAWVRMTFISQTELLPVSNAGAKGSAIRKAWDEMNKIAKLLGSELEYVKQ